MNLPSLPIKVSRRASKHKSPDIVVTVTESGDGSDEKSSNEMWKSISNNSTLKSDSVESKIPLKIQNEISEGRLSTISSGRERRSSLVMAMERMEQRDQTKGVEHKRRATIVGIKINPALLENSPKPSTMNLADEQKLLPIISQGLSSNAKKSKETLQFPPVDAPRQRRASLTPNSNLKPADPTVQKKELNYYLHRDYSNNPLWEMLGREKSVSRPKSSIGNPAEANLRAHSSFRRPVSAIHRDEQIPSLSPEMCKKYWIRIFRISKVLSRIVKHYTKHKNSAEKLLLDYPPGDTTLIGLKTHHSNHNPDPFSVEKVKEILLIPPNGRSEEDTKKLNLLLKSVIPDFAKYPKEEMLEFCKLMTLESHNARKLLFKENHRPSCFYFILSGQVETFKLNNGVRDCVNFVEAGKMFGHRIFDHGAARRTAYAATTMPSNLLYMNDESYHFIIEKNKAKTSAIIFEKLHNTPLFENHEDFLKSLLPYFQMYSFSRNQVIQEEGKQTVEFYFIMEGTCRVTQRVSISKSNVKSKGKDTVKSDGSYSTVRVETLQISAGDNFPPVPDLYPDGSMKYLGPTVIDTNLYVDFYTNLWMNDSRTFSKASLECEFDVYVAAIPFLDFFRFAPKEVVFSLVMEPRVRIFTIEEVQKQFEIENKWKGYRKSIIAEYQE